MNDEKRLFDIFAEAWRSLAYRLDEKFKSQRRIDAALDRHVLALRRCETREDTRFLVMSFLADADVGISQDEAGLVWCQFDETSENWRMVRDAVLAAKAIREGT